MISASVLKEERIIQTKGIIQIIAPIAKAIPIAILARRLLCISLVIFCYLTYN